MRSIMTCCICKWSLAQQHIEKGCIHLSVPIGLSYSVTWCWCVNLVYLNKNEIPLSPPAWCMHVNHSVIWNEAVLYEFCGRNPISSKEQMGNLVLPSWLLTDKKEKSNSVPCKHTHWPLVVCVKQKINKQKSHHRPPSIFTLRGFQTIPSNDWDVKYQCTTLNQSWSLMAWGDYIFNKTTRNVTA